MPILTSRKIQGRKTFDPELYNNAKKALWNQVEANPKKVPADTDTERFTKYIDALSLHMGGMAIKDAALAHGIVPGSLETFKRRWISNDNGVRVLLANMLEAGAVQSMKVFVKKAEDMDAPEAAQAAATLTKSAVALRQGEATGYQVPEHVSLGILDRVTNLLNACRERTDLQLPKPKPVIDV